MGFATMWMALENIILSEMSGKKQILYGIHMWKLKVMQTNVCGK